MKTTNNTAALLAGLALLITVMVTMAFWSFNRIEIASEARRHTNSIFTSADNVLSALTVAETGQRGYLLTGDESFLQPYLSVRDSISGNLNILRQQTRISAARIHLAWARSGDKGDAFNIGVIARKPDYLPWIRAALSSESMMDWFAHEFEGGANPAVLRYDVPGLNAVNLHFLDALGGGQFASLRLDPLAKGKAQQLLDMPVNVPVGLV